MSSQALFTLRRGGASRRTDGVRATLGKLRPSRPAPARLAPPRGLVAWRLDEDDEVALLEWPTAEPSTPDGLTSAELEVLTLVREGLSNGDIAVRRGRSVRTVANQIASIFAKCGVRSRSELFALSGGGRGRSAG